MFLTNDRNRKRILYIAFEASKFYTGGGQNENTGSKNESKGLGLEKHLWIIEGRTDSKGSES
jgi:hypothetical protein